MVETLLWREDVSVEVVFVVLDDPLPLKLSQSTLDTILALALKRTADKGGGGIESGPPTSSDIHR